MIMKLIHKIRSWHIVLLGIVIQVGIGYLLFSDIAHYTTYNLGNGMQIGEIFAVAIGIMLMLGSIFGILPLLLLYFKKTLNIGGIISIILGIVALVTELGIIVGIFMIIAGILAIWKEI